MTKEADMDEPTEATDVNQSGPPLVGEDDAQRIVVTLSAEAYRKLKGTADRTHLSVADLVKNGLALADWIEDENSRGSQLLIKRGGRLREVTLPGKGEDSSR
jgi:hypothetical protein